MVLIFCFLLSTSLYGAYDRQLTEDTYPDPSQTSGDIFSDVAVSQLCGGKYSRKTRHVPSSLKREIKSNYHIDPDQFSDYSIDHFIPISLGGTNEVQNLWPQKVKGIVYGAAQKSLSDDYLHRQVCAGNMTLEKAQNLIINDWVKVFRECCRFIKVNKRKKKRPVIEQMLEDIDAIIGGQEGIE